MEYLSCGVVLGLAVVAVTSGDPFRDVIPES